eukprot:gene18427-biopygen21954
MCWSGASPQLGYSILRMSSLMNRKTGVSGAGVRGALRGLCGPTGAQMAMEIDGMHAEWAGRHKDQALRDGVRPFPATFADNDPGIQSSSDESDQLQGVWIKGKDNPQRDSPGQPTGTGEAGPPQTPGQGGVGNAVAPHFASGPSHCPGCGLTPEPGMRLCVGCIGSGSTSAVPGGSGSPPVDPLNDTLQSVGRDHFGGGLLGRPLTALEGERAGGGGGVGLAGLTSGADDGDCEAPDRRSSGAAPLPGSPQLEPPDVVALTDPAAQRDDPLDRAGRCTPKGDSVPQAASAACDSRRRLMGSTLQLTLEQSQVDWWWHTLLPMDVSGLLDGNRALPCLRFDTEAHQVLSGARPCGVGFCNLGNSCWLGSALQVLLACPGFCAALRGGEFMEDLLVSLDGKQSARHGAPFLMALADLLAARDKGTYAAIPPARLRLLAALRPGLLGHSAGDRCTRAVGCDSVACLRGLLDFMHSEANRSATVPPPGGGDAPGDRWAREFAGKDSIISRYFSGSTRGRITCGRPQCARSWQVEEELWVSEWRVPKEGRGKHAKKN